MKKEEFEVLIEELRALPQESEWVEFKVNNSKPDEIGEYISALSNSACLENKEFGYLVYGIEDKTHKIAGTDFKPKAKKIGNQELENWLATQLEPKIDFKIFEHKVNEKSIVLFQIDAALNTPVSWKGEAYIRVGSYKKKLKDHPEKARKIWQKAESYDWSAAICENATINDLSKKAILKARQSFKSKNPKLKIEVENWDDITFLNKSKLCIKGKITNSAIILLGNPESEHFIAPSTSKITWILKDNNNVEKDYQHFTCPLILSVEDIHNKIRNLKYRYIVDNSLFPDEIDQYDPYVIREALHNCIAHQDYQKNGRINIVECEEGKLVFTNLGSFIPGSIESVIESDSPENYYRNSFLTNAMVSLNMIDTIGSGIKKMFTIQKNRFFPLPEYNLTNDQVKVTIYGKVLNLEYSQKLAQMPGLSLYDIILLDKVAKNKLPTKDEINYLKRKKLIEGRKPNYHISLSVAKNTEQKSDYIKLKGIDDNYCRTIILDYLHKFGKGTRSDFEKILLDKLSDRLDENQKINKIKNTLQKLKSAGSIRLESGKLWVLSK